MLSQLANSTFVLYLTMSGYFISLIIKIREIDEQEESIEQKSIEPRVSEAKVMLRLMV